MKFEALDPHLNFGREEAVQRHEFTPRTHDFELNLQPSSKKSGQNDTAEPASSRLKGIHGWFFTTGRHDFWPKSRGFIDILCKLVGKSRGKSHESETPYKH
jgi:hypothetical protein